MWPALPTPTGSMNDSLVRLIDGLVPEAYPAGPILDPCAARLAAGTFLRHLRRHFSVTRPFLAALSPTESPDSVPRLLLGRQHDLIRALSHDLCVGIRSCDGRPSIRAARQLRAVLLEHLAFENEVLERTLRPRSGALRRSPGAP